MEKCAIIKFVNYNTATLNRAKRLSRYIKALSRTNEKYVATQYISKANAEHGLQVIEDRWKPKGKRSFKQGILSFGVSCNEFSPEEALKMTEETLQYYRHLPWLAAVHINKPQHLHAHFLLGMTSIFDGKKYSQGPSDLQKFKRYYNSIARKHGLPLVHGYGMDAHADSSAQTLNPQVVRVDVHNKPEWHYPENTWNTLNPSQLGVPSYPASIYPQPQQTKGIFDDYREDFGRFFLLGYEKGNL